MRNDARAIVTLALASLACACGVRGNIQAPDDRGQALLQAAFVVPDVEAAPPRAPIALTASDGTGLTLRSLVARTRVNGPLAETEVHLGFSSSEPRIREGRFRIALPQHAFVSRLAMMIDGRMQESEISEISRAREVYDEIVHRRRDPLLVEQHGTNELSARVFPIDRSR